MYEIRRINPRTEPRLVDEFQAKQRLCYERYEVQNAASQIAIPRTAILDGTVHFIVAVAPSGELVGGTRIHVRRPGNPLPMERALLHDAQLRAVLDRVQPQGVAEYAGLWALPSVRGVGLSGVLSCLAVAITPSLGVKHGCGFTHHHLLFWTPLGFRLDEKLGFFAYPDERYQSYVLWVDPKDLRGADPAYSKVIHDMRTAQGRRILWSPQNESITQQIHIEDAVALSAVALPGRA